ATRRHGSVRGGGQGHCLARRGVDGQHGSGPDDLAGRARYWRAECYSASRRPRPPGARNPYQRQGKTRVRCGCAREFRYQALNDRTHVRRGPLDRLAAIASLAFIADFATKQWALRALAGGDLPLGAGWHLTVINNT